MVILCSRNSQAQLEQSIRTKMILFAQSVRKQFSLWSIALVRKVTNSNPIQGRVLSG